MKSKSYSLLLAGAMLTLSAATSAAVIPVPADYQPPFFGEAGALKGLVITLDPGHGGSSFSEGYHGSARGINSRLVEGDLNMRVSGLLFHHLKDAGATVHLTRRDDRKITLGATGRSVELGARTKMADDTRSHLFLSLHHNSATRRTADGIMMLIWPKDSKGQDQPLETAFANIMRDELKLYIHQSEHFNHYLNEHPLVTYSDIPSAVVEFGFLSNPEFDSWVAKPTSHKDEARGAYSAIVRMWSEHKVALVNLRTELFPDTLTPTQEMARETPSDSVFPLGRPARHVWPFEFPATTTDHARFIADAVRLSTLTDRTSFHIATSVSLKDGEWSATVTTNLPQIAGGIRSEISKATGREGKVTVDPLPSAALGNDPFAVVSIPMALTWVEPREGGSVQTQVLHGEPLFLLDVTEQEDYYLVQGIDGYVGWLRADAVQRLTRDEFTSLMRSPQARAKSDIRDNAFSIPPASLVTIQHDDPTTTVVGITRGDGKSLTTDRSRLHKVNPHGIGKAVAEIAIREYLYVPYVFGGRSNQGTDCSGVVGASWAAVGVQLPRDANQQVLVGRLVATPWYMDAMEAGDVLFFVDERGRVFHTGVSLGGKNFIHASPPEVQISSLDPADPLYSPTWHKAFISARRPAE